MDLVHTNKRN